MTHREIEELGLEGDRPVHNLLKRERHRQARNLPPKRKGRPRIKPLTTVEACHKEIARLEMENKLLWEIFCSPQKGCEAEVKVSCHLPSSARISGIGNVPILWGVQKRILRLRKAAGTA